MAGSRRTQRSVRVTVAASLVGAAAVVVLVSVVSALLVSVAAVLAVVAGAAAARIVYAEVLQTRRDAARHRAEQALSFRDVLAERHAERMAFATAMTGRLQERDATIGALGEALRIAERRGVEAEARVLREAQRANEAQERLGGLLDEVFGTAAYDVDADRQGDLVELPAIIDRLGWHSQTKAS